MLSQLQSVGCLCCSVSECRLLESLALSEKKSNRSKMFGHSQSGVTSDQSKSGLTSGQSQSGRSQSGGTSSYVKLFESNANSDDPNAIHCLADGRSQESAKNNDSAWHRYCLADKRSLVTPPAPDDINRVTLPRTHGKARTGHWLRSGLGSETSKEVPTDSEVTPVRARQASDDDLRTAEMMMSSRSDRLLSKDAPDSDAKRRSKCSSHCRSPSLVTFSAKDDKSTDLLHSTHQQHHHHHHQQQCRGSGDGQRVMTGFDQMESAPSFSSSSSKTHDGECLFRRHSPETNTKQTTSVGQKRTHPLRLQSKGVASLSEDRLKNCVGTNDPIETSAVARRSDELSKGRCSDPDLVKREKPDGATQKAFGRRLQAIGSSIDAGRTTRLDYCNSLPRVLRARRSESVGCSAKRDVTVGRSNEARHSFGSSFAELMSLLSASTSLPTTPKRSMSRDDDSDGKLRLYPR